jgi:hypothetical protein
MKTPMVAFRPFARTRNLQLDQEGVVWTRDVDTADEFVAGHALGHVLGRIEISCESARELATLRSRWAARDRIEDLHAEALRTFRAGQGI